MAVIDPLNASKIEVIICKTEVITYKIDVITCKIEVMTFINVLYMWHRDVIINVIKCIKSLRCVGIIEFSFTSVSVKFYFFPSWALQVKCIYNICNLIIILIESILKCVDIFLIIEFPSDSESNIVLKRRQDVCRKILLNDFIIFVIW